jgi:predicted outer membrane repeat protein
MEGGTISSNVATGSGGGVYGNNYASIEVAGGTIGGASAGNSAGVKGGGVYYIESSDITLSGGFITHNSAAADSGNANNVGGGIHVGASAQLLDVSGIVTVVDDNSADSADSSGRTCQNIFYRDGYGQTACHPVETDAE